MLLTIFKVVLQDTGLFHLSVVFCLLTTIPFYSPFFLSMRPDQYNYLRILQLMWLTSATSNSTIIALLILSILKLLKPFIRNASICFIGFGDVGICIIASDLQVNCFFFYQDLLFPPVSVCVPDPTQSLNYSTFTTKKLLNTYMYFYSIPMCCRGTMHSK